MGWGYIYILYYVYIYIMREQAVAWLPAFPLSQSCAFDPFVWVCGWVDPSHDKTS